jgi:hypothetical protein
MDSGTARTIKYGILELQVGVLGQQRRRVSLIGLGQARLWKRCPGCFKARSRLQTPYNMLKWEFSVEKLARTNNHANHPQSGRVSDACVCGASAFTNDGRD